VAMRQMCGAWRLRRNADLTNATGCGLRMRLYIMNMVRRTIIAIRSLVEERGIVTALAATMGQRGSPSPQFPY
jgi:hypothetical protein